MELTVDQALQKGVEAHKAGQIQEADKFYTAILKAQPKHPDANHNMGVLAVGVGKIQEALPFFKTALDANSSIGQYWLSYIDALIKLGRSAEAQIVLDQAKDKGVTGEAFNQLDRQLSETRVNPQDPPSDQLQSIINLFTQGHLQQALSESNQVLESFPHSVALYNIAGACNRGLMQFDTAINNYKQALKIKPDYAEAYNNMGNALKDKGDLKAAVESYRQALKINPGYAEVYYNIGVSLKGKGDLEAAIASYKQALKIKPDYAEAYNNIGIALNDKGDLEAAIVNYKQAIRINPDYAEAYNNMGVTLKGKGDLEATINSYKQALKIKPDYAGAYNNMGNALKDKGDLKAAVDSLRQSIALNPDYSEAHNNLGTILQELGRLKAAEACYRKAIALNPDYAEAYSNLGSILIEFGRKEQAEASYRRAIALKPDFAISHYKLGMLLLEVNHYEKAAEKFKFSDFKKSKYYLLKCLYLQDKKSLFYDQLDDSISQGDIHPIIGSLGCRSALKYGVERSNLFCKDPLNYVVKTDLSHQYDFGKIFVNTARTLLNENRIENRAQPLLTNGYQTSSNLFALEHNLTEDIQKIIRLEIEKYLANFKSSKEGLITSWPPDYTLYGWLVSMKSGGALRPHMHDEGWISGSIYINVPSKLKADSGNLVVCIEEEQLTGQNINQSKSIDVVTGSLCLFPASLLHYTIPFESEEDRIVLAFDVIPNN